MIAGNGKNAGGRSRGLLTFTALLAAPLALVAVGAVGQLASPLQAKESAGPKTHVVEIRQFKFFPATLEVKPGDVIIWRNLDIAPHTATAKNWDSGNLGKDQSWSLKVTSKGTIEYICAYHPAMKGKIVVK